MTSGELSIGEAQKTCQVSNKTAYSWRKGSSRKSISEQQKTPKPGPKFAKIKVLCDEPLAQSQTPLLVFRRAGCEALLPPSFPIDQLAQSIRAFERDP